MLAQLLTGAPHAANVVQRFSAGQLAMRHMGWTPAVQNELEQLVLKLVNTDPRTRPSIPSAIEKLENIQVRVVFCFYFTLFALLRTARHFAAFAFARSCAPPSHAVGSGLFVRLQDSVLIVDVAESFRSPGNALGRAQEARAQEGDAVFA